MVTNLFDFYGILIFFVPIFFFLLALKLNFYKNELKKRLFELKKKLEFDDTFRNSIKAKQGFSALVQYFIENLNEKTLFRKLHDYFSLFSFKHPISIVILAIATGLSSIVMVLVIVWAHEYFVYTFIFILYLLLTFNLIFDLEINKLIKYANYICREELFPADKEYLEKVYFLVRIRIKHLIMIGALIGIFNIFLGLFAMDFLNEERKIIYNIIISNFASSGSPIIPLLVFSFYLMTFLFVIVLSLKFVFNYYFKTRVSLKLDMITSNQSINVKKTLINFRYLKIGLNNVIEQSFIIFVLIGVIITYIGFLFTSHLPEKPRFDVFLATLLPYIIFVGIWILIGLSFRKGINYLLDWTGTKTKNKKKNVVNNNPRLSK